MPDGPISPDLFGNESDLVALALARLRQFEPPEGYYLAFSGGKDSVVILALAQRAGVRHDAHFNLTSLDPPELLSFVRGTFPQVSLHRPKRSFFRLLVTQGFPRRASRWCCQALKERGFGRGRTVITGVRRAESALRRERRVVESCPTESKHFLHPIIDWPDALVWQYIHSNNLPYCHLYDEGFKRLGCICCPMTNAGQRRLHLQRWPKFEKAFRAAFKRLYDHRKATGSKAVDRWPDSDAMFDYWVGDDTRIPHPNQTALTFQDD